MRLYSIESLRSLVYTKGLANYIFHVLLWKPFIAGRGRFSFIGARFSFCLSVEKPDGKCPSNNTKDADTALQAMRGAWRVLLVMQLHWGHCMPDTTLRARCYAWRVLLVMQLGSLLTRHGLAGDALSLEGLACHAVCKEFSATL